MSAEQQTDSGLHFLDYWRVIRARKEIVLAVVLLVTITGAAYTFSLPKIYMATSRIEVREDAPDVDIWENRGGYANTYNMFFMRTQFEIIKSQAILSRVLESTSLNLMQEWTKIHGNLSKEDALRLLAGMTKVDQYRDTSLIEIKAFSESQEEARNLANVVATEYQNYRQEQKVHEVRRGLDAIEDELRKQQDVVKKADEAVEAIRQTNKVATTGGRNFTVEKNRLQQLEELRLQAKTEMITAKTRYDQISPLTRDQILDTWPFITRDDTLSSLQQTYMQLDTQLKQSLVSFGEEHPDVKRLRTAVEDQRKKLDARVDGLLVGLKASYEIARGKYDVVNADYELASKAEIDSSTLNSLTLDKAEREAQGERDMLSVLKARLKQKVIDTQVPTTPVRIIDRAEKPSRPVSPNYMLNIALSLIIGLGLGVGLAYFIEYLDTSVKTIEDVERLLSLRVIGVIPQKVRLLSEQRGDAPHAEAYRVLRTNMQFANKGRRGSAFSIASGGAGEGKSTTLFNLAYVCAQLGDKVIIVDSDLRRPVQHTFLGLANKVGMTNVLLRDLPVEEAIQATNIPNLHFMPSGRLPRSSLGLLDTQRMRELVKNLKARYDYVFFDSPPIVGVSDASILASEVDGVLLVVQYRKYPRSITVRAKRLLENVGTNIIGVVLNNINIMRDDYYYYYHSYYSQYYGHDENAAQDAGTPENPPEPPASGRKAT